MLEDGFSIHKYMNSVKWPAVEICLWFEIVQMSLSFIF